MNLSNTPTGSGSRSGSKTKQHADEKKQHAGKKERVLENSQKDGLGSPKKDGLKGEIVVTTQQEKGSSSPLDDLVKPEELAVAVQMRYLECFTKE